VGNLVAGLTGSFSVDASPPRSAVVATSGGRSQLASLVAAAGCVLVVALATGLLSGLPQATLGAILVFVATRLFHVKDLRAIRHFDRAEYVVTWVTIIAVALFGIETGVLVALILALAQRTRMAARPRDAVMGREPGTDHWVPTEAAPTEQVPGVVVYLLLAPLWFGNADYVVERVRKVVASAPPPLRALVLDAAGVADIDFTGAQALHGLIGELRAKEIRVAVARAAGMVPTELRRSPLLADIGPGNVFDNVEAAVRSLSAATPSAP
jgi:SulP family sulfate permease